MNSTMFLTVCSFFYSVLLLFLIFFKKKKRINDSERKIYNILVISNFLGILIELLCVITCRNYKRIPIINGVVLRLYLIYLLTWIITFTRYIFSISMNKNSKKYCKLQKIFNIFILILYVVISILIFILPIKYHVENNMIMYIYGSSTNMLYMFVEAFVILCLILMFSNPKNIKGTKYAPLFIFIAGGAAIMVIQSINPSWLLMTSMETFITFLMYFTIESEDSIKSNDNEKITNNKN